jgi:hypothetical protein
MVISPCINVCRMEAGVCAGCFRTIEEITGWASLGDEGKRLIVASAAQRRLRLDPDCDLVCNCTDG